MILRSNKKSPVLTTNPGVTRINVAIHSTPFARRWAAFNRKARLVSNIAIPLARAKLLVPNAQSPCSQHCSWVGNAKNAAR
ncbi:Uncharacterised protein [Vibrio cholerae]|nr:Uncharacterised protein [Vibrio cholerae]